MAGRNATPRDRVTVRVPATSANLGPGFDALAVALDLSEDVTLARLPAHASARVRVTGVNASLLPHDETLLAYRGVVAAYRRMGRALPALDLELATRIPRSGGLGGSAAAIVAGVVAANALEGSPLSRMEELDLVAGIEGHPDNVSAALLGGLVVCVAARDGLVSKRLSVPTDLHAVLCLPETSISTKSARGVIPQSFPIGDAVFNLGRTALIVAAFATRDWSLLRDGMDDRIHQPARGTILAALHPVIAAAIDAGAHGAALSGAGSAMIAFASDHFDEIAVAMSDAAARHGSPNRTIRLALSDSGARVIA
jgi:homoserine kinase